PPADRGGREHQHTRAARLRAHLGLHLRDLAARGRTATSGSVQLPRDRRAGADPPHRGPLRAGPRPVGCQRPRRAAGRSVTADDRWVPSARARLAPALRNDVRFVAWAATAAITMLALFLR